MRLPALVLLLASSAAAAQTVAVSPAPDSVDVTIYRDQGRPDSQRMRLSWLNGYALVSETRRVRLPAGEADIRFEGVAGGIIPQSAIVTGLPEGIVERNRDALLLSPGSLLDRSLGRRVHLRRTSRATGEVREQEAIVRSGPAGAVVLQTEAGFEALRCTGLAETLTYDEVPPGLSAKPTLSVRARSSRAVEADVTLSYLATGFDWQAAYVADLSPDGDRMSLFGWLTLASSDETSFVRADTQAVAGRINRRYVPRQPVEAPPLTLSCWPSDTTSDIEALEEEIYVTGSRLPPPMAMAPPPPPPPPSPPPPPAPAMMAEQEDLGDLKLYRIPEPVTVAANAQKQVAMLARADIPVELVNRQHFFLPQPEWSQPVQRVLRAQNVAGQGLGLPLPAGSVTLYAPREGQRLLVGRGTMRDRAVGEEVEIVIGPATALRAQATPLAPVDEKNVEWTLTVANSSPSPVRYEAVLNEGDMELSTEVPLARRNGRDVWAVTIPANGRAELRYRLRRTD